MTVHFESKCLFCELSGAYKIANTCQTCFSALERLPHSCLTCALPVPEGVETCGQCQKKPPVMDHVYAACPYEQGIDSLIRNLKDNGEFSTLDIFAVLIEECLRKARTRLPDLIVPVPLHPLRRMWRGFNQADLIAEKLGASLDIEVAHQALGRRMSTDQRTLNLSRRFDNMRQAFYLKSTALEGMRVAILDDVMTTGATLNSAARTLKAGGALRVDAWVLARTLRH
jgi:ComF family protein